MVADIQKTPPPDGDEILVKIIFRVKLAINYCRIRLIHFEDFVFAVLFERDDDSIVIHAVLRSWFSAIVDSKDLFGSGLRTNLLFLRLNHLARDRMICIWRNLFEE